ncbi:glycosyltransferase [Salinibius halmophilus]|uniref:glycosyltransferase n=1 Tax=Salinibius halmophilus TaxID=1853216 RepID=UPI000E670817|nr:glycosyltransferase [Salinibius halmophilus]
MQYQTVLIIGYVWPEPNSSAAGKRMLDLINFFTARSEKVAFATPAQDSPHKAELVNVDTHEIKLNCSSFNEFCAQLNPQIVMFDRFMMEEQFGWRVAQACPQALRILDTEDLHCLRDARHQHFKKTGEMLLQPNIAQLTSDVAKRELAAIWRSDLTLMISPVEIQLLTQTFSVHAALLHYSPLWLNKLENGLGNAVEKCVSSFEDSQSLASERCVSRFEERQHFVCIGSFRHAPNWDSVLWLNSEIWPAIRKRLPNAELHIYGSYPPPKATALHNPKKGFHIKGWANDAFEVLSKARVCLAPLRFGAGIKGKFVDALQVGTPSVTTSIGSEGMFAPWPGQVANDVDALVEAAVQLYQDPEQWQTAHEHAKQLAARYYQAVAYQAELAARLDQLLSELETHRANNFIGAMLQHQTLKSTQYMSQWIEQKQLNAQKQ